MNMLQLTEPHGGSIWLVAAWIEAFTPPVGDEAPFGTGTKIFMSGFNIFVKEKPEIVALMLRGGS